MIQYTALEEIKRITPDQRIQEWLPQRHLARFIVDTVEMLDLNNIYKEYNNGGKEAYDPRSLLSLLFYGYILQVLSPAEK